MRAARNGTRGLPTATVLIAVTLTFAHFRGGYADSYAEIYRPPELLNPITIVKNIPYNEGADPEHEHKLDIYYPDDGRQHTVLVFIHGGGLIQGDKSLYNELGCTFSSYHDYATVIVNYELSNPDDGQAVHPDHIKDIADAFAWIVEHIDDAEYDGAGDPERIFLFGQSAGGFLNSLLATDGQYLDSVGCSREQIKGVITMSGMYNLYGYTKYPDNPFGLSPEEVGQYRLMLGTTMGGIRPSILIPASPFWHVSASQPPFCIIYADYDMPGIEVDAVNFYDEIASYEYQNPELVYLTSEDLEIVWEAAVEAAIEAGFSEEGAGHWAEIMAVNTHDGNPYNEATTRVVEFVESH